jgi:trk system potassium uptake protein TrkH
MGWLAERWRRLSPPALLVASFLLLVAVGTAGLLLLPGIYTGPRLSPLDALFTATSAACVTGLVVVDTATFFTRLGQLWLLGLIQLGGLGLVALSTLVIGALGRRLSLRSELIALPEVGGAGLDVTSLMLAIARFTLAIEAAGALLLFPLFAADHAVGDALWHAVFHSVSAFCNAGFSTFPTSLEEHARRPGVLLVVSLLVIAGGLGYLATGELLRWGRPSARRRLSSHTWAVVVTTAALVAGGAALFTAFEWDGVLAPLGSLDRLANGWFMSVTARTAGFNSVRYADVTNETALLTILLMIIGGSPGSTAGGLKTTTAAILVALAISRIRGRRHVELHHRTVPDGTVERTVSVVLLGSAIATVGVFLLAAAHPVHASLDDARRQVLPMLFEAVSAFATVGLSMGQTAELGPLGKLVVVVLMFLGRVGPLAFFAAISVKARGGAAVRAAREDVIVG